MKAYSLKPIACGWMVIRFQFCRTIGLWAICYLLLASAASAAIVSQPVDYSENGQALQGVLYYDDAVKTKQPGVIVVHEWKGLGDYAKKRAEMVAKLGDVTFAADMYGQGVFAETHEKAAALSSIYFKDRLRMRARAQAAYDAFLKTGKVDETKVAAMGYYFGGTTVLEMARSGMPLKGVASFHGVLVTPTPAEKGKIQASILVMTGADDKMVLAQDIQNFQTEMNTADAKFVVRSFNGAMHGFTVWDANMPEKGIQYNKSADKQSWKMLEKFLAEIFKVKS